MQTLDYPFCQGCSVSEIQICSEESTGKYPARFFVQFQHGEKLFSENNPAENFYCIKSGKVILSKFNSEGKEEIIGVAYAGDLIGLDSIAFDIQHHNSARAYKEITACKISKQNLFSQSEKYSDLILNLLKKLSKKIKASDCIT